MSEIGRSCGRQVQSSCASQEVDHTSQSASEPPWIGSARTAPLCWNARPWRRAEHTDSRIPSKTKNIPVISIHSVTPETLPILHNRRDNLAAVRMDDYYLTYRLIASYLAY